MSVSVSDWLSESMSEMSLHYYILCKVHDCGLCKVKTAKSYCLQNLTKLACTLYLQNNETH